MDNPQNGFLYYNEINYVHFSYYDYDYNVSGPFNVSDLINSGYIIGFTCSNYANVWFEGENVAISFYGWNDIFDINFTIASGNSWDFRFYVSNRDFSQFPKETLINAYNMYYQTGELPCFYKTSVYIAGFSDSAYSGPTPEGNMFVFDTRDSTNSFFVGGLSFNFDLFYTLIFNGHDFAFQMSFDFWNGPCLGIDTSGIAVYPNNLAIGDRLDIYYTIMYGQVYGIVYDSLLLGNHQTNNEPNTTWVDSFAEAENYCAMYGYRTHLFEMNVQINGYYSLNTSPTSRGIYYVRDLTGSYRDYTMYTTFDSNPFNNNNGTYTYTTSSDYLTNDIYLGTSANGEPIYPRNLVPGDILTITFYMQTYYRIYACATGWQLTNVRTFSEPSVIETNLSTIFSGYVNVMEYAFHTYGYLASVSGNTMYFTENDPSLGGETFYAYRVSFDANSVVYDPNMGRYVFYIDNNYSTNYMNSGIAVGDYVELFGCRCDYRDTKEMAVVILNFTHNS